MFESQQFDARVLITGAHGFVGTQLLAVLQKRHPEWTLSRPLTRSSKQDGPETLDVTDAEAMTAWVRAFKPDIAIHLAAVSAVTAAVKDPRQAWAVNLGGTLNLTFALRAHVPACHLLYVSSAEVYGESFRASSPVDESTLLQPVNPYAASKAAADLLVQQLIIEGLSATVMRPFNHIGLGQSELFVVPNFAAQIARIEAKIQPAEIFVGSLDEERDFLNLGDVIEAYILALDFRATAAKGQIFNVASGESVRIGDILERLLSKSSVSISVKVDPARLRRQPIPRVLGNANKLHRALSWSPSITLDETLDAVLDEKRYIIQLGNPGHSSI